MEFMNQPAFVTPCSNGAGNQYWWYNDNRYLMRDYLCVGVLPDFEQVSLELCSSYVLYEGPSAYSNMLRQKNSVTEGKSHSIY